MALPLQGAYSASKHAVKAFTNALRMELMRERAPVSVTLIKPSAVDTPYKEHARNLTGAGSDPAAGLCDAAGRPGHPLRRRATRCGSWRSGSSGPILAFVAGLAPSLTEPMIAIIAPILQRDPNAAAKVRADNLYQAGADLRERAYHKGVRQESLYTAAQMRPKATLTMGLLAGLAAGAALFGGRRLTAQGRAGARSGALRALPRRSRAP